MFKVYAPGMTYTPAAKDYYYETPKLGEKVEVLTTLNDEAFYDGSHYAWAYVATVIDILVMNYNTKEERETWE